MKIFDSFSEWFDGHQEMLDALVFDIDGVLLLEKKPVAGSLELLQKLRDHNIPFSLLTNDACNSIEEKRAHLKEAGIEFAAEEIISAGHGLVELVQKRGLSDTLFFMMGTLGEPCYAQLAGLRITRDLKELPDCVGVVVGEKRYDWQRTFNAVVNYFIHKSDALFIVPNPDEYFPVNSDRIELASGATARFIQRVLQKCGVDIEPVYVGKPHSLIFEHCHAQFEAKLNRSLPRQRVAIIGDSLESDVLGGLNFGYRSALVLSGLTDTAMLKNSQVKPDLVFKRL